MATAAFGGGRRQTVPQQARLAIMFADIASSTQLYVNLGDVRARDIVACCIDVMIETARRCGGAPIRTIGDEILTAFASVDAAVEAAREMQERVTGAIAPDGQSLAIRIGFHFGQALLEESDIHGEAVNLAARLAAEAKPGQILTTGATVAAMTESERTFCRQIDLARMKGTREAVPIFELLWQSGDATMMSEPWAPRRRQARKLVLTVGNQWRELSEAHPLLTMGRAEENDLVVRLPFVSRLHARVEYRHGRFVLSDMSTNGIYIVSADGASSFLRRESQELTGAGALGLGETISADPAMVVRFKPE
jgi:adenylate cyclase